MRILLVGEFSSVHITLAKALRKLGHEVDVISDGDDYKNYDRNINFINLKPKKRCFIRKIIFACGYILGINGFKTYIRNKKTINQLKNYDVIQLINTAPFQGVGALFNFLIIANLNRHNDKLFLCALGDDYQWVSACLNKLYKYSPLDRLNIKTLKNYIYSLKYVYSPLYFLLNYYVIKKSTRIIPGLYDYWLAYKHNPKCTQIIPLPIAEENFHTPNITQYPIKIFHGWQKGKDNKKGNDLLDIAVKKIKQKYPDLIDYNIVQNVSYSEYLKLFQECDIFLDQCFSYDYGVNGALGLTAAKVVFSGFEKDNNKFSVGINALPNEEYLYHQLECLIHDTHKIDILKKNAKNYAEKHKSLKVALLYINAWTSLK